MSEKKQKPELTDEEVLQREEKPKPAEIVSLDVEDEGEETPELDEETTLDLLQEAQEEEYAEKIAQHTKDEAIQDSLEARQDLDTGRDKLHDQLQQHHAKSPNLSAEDVDAAWDEANVGEEAVGGMAPTPDQDDVDEIGEALGITYEDDEPLQTGEKLSERDEERWELDPESAEETA